MMRPPSTMPHGDDSSRTGSPPSICHNWLRQPHVCMQIVVGAGALVIVLQPLTTCAAAAPKPCYIPLTTPIALTPCTVRIPPQRVKHQCCLLHNPPWFCPHRKQTLSRHSHQGCGPYRSDASAQYDHMCSSHLLNPAPSQLDTHVSHSMHCQ